MNDEQLKREMIEAGHTFCETCKDWTHSCANCDGEYCDCSEAQWAEGKNGITYCSQECADADGDSEA